jgi:hypothetical protein
MCLTSYKYKVSMILGGNFIKKTFQVLQNVDTWKVIEIQIERYKSSTSSLYVYMCCYYLL